MDDIRTRIAQRVPGVDVEFVMVLQDLIGDLAGAPQPVEVKLFGENQAELEATAQKLASRIEKIRGVVDVQSGVVEAGPELVARVDPTQVGRFGLSSEDVAAQVNAAMFGDQVTQLLQGDREIGVRVRYPASYRSNLSQMASIPIRTPAGFVVPLKTVARIQSVPGTTELNRENQRRVVSVSANLSGRDLGSALSDVQRVMRRTPLPGGVTYTLGGQFESQRQAFRGLFAVIALAILLVFAVMLFQFSSFTPPLVILLIMPLSMFGVVFGLWLTGTPLNVSSFMGAVMLVGIVVKNGILLLDQAQKARKSGMSLEDSILQAGRLRLRPILMTTLTAILGLVPLSLGLGAGAEMQKPLAIAVIGGLSLSTVFTLVFAPLLYVRMMGRRTKAGKA